MKKDIDSFLRLNTSGQIKYLKHGDFSQLPAAERIEFLKNILSLELSSKTIASGLKLLRELKFRDRTFYTKFLYHSDSSVSNAARKAVDESSGNKDSGAMRLVDLVKNGDSGERLDLVRSVLDQKGKVSASVLVSLLAIDDFTLREFIVHHIGPEHQIDETALSESLKHSVCLSGPHWSKYSVNGKVSRFSICRTYCSVIRMSK